jgi:hypothetical protein
MKLLSALATAAGLFVLAKAEVIVDIDYCDNGSQIGNDWTNVVNLVNGNGYGSWTEIGTTTIGGKTLYVMAVGNFADGYTDDLLSTLNNNYNVNTGNWIQIRNLGGVDASSATQLDENWITAYTSGYHSTPPSDESCDAETGTYTKKKRSRF